MHIKSFIKTITLIGTTLLLSSCEQAIKDQISNVVDASSKDTIVRAAGYELTVPSHLKKVTTLHEEASMQFQNVYKETYLIVIDEPKDTLISTYQDLGEYKNDSSVVKNYRDIQLAHIKESLKITSQTPSKSFKINGLEAESIEIDGEVPDIKYPISYIYTFVAGPEKVYMIMAWTLKDRKDKHHEMFEKVINSFKVLKK